MPGEEIFNDLEKKMKSSIESLKRDLNRVRTGRASTSLLDSVKMNYYGTPTPITQVASISIPESRLIIVQPWDRTIITDIEKALMSSDLGLTPSNDGNVIRLPIPMLTEERRKELVKVVKKNVEESKISIRTIRREAIETLKKMEKNKEISEDELRKATETVQKTTDKFVKISDENSAIKETELMND